MAEVLIEFITVISYGRSTKSISIQAPKQLGITSNKDHLYYKLQYSFFFNGVVQNKYFQ